MSKLSKIVQGKGSQKTMRVGRRVPTAPAPYVPLTTLKPTKTALTKMRKEQLVKELEVRGLDGTGSKDLLVSRLLRVLQDPEAATPGLPKVHLVPDAVQDITLPAAAEPAVAIIGLMSEDVVPAEVEVLKKSKAELESALTTANAALASTQEKAEADKQQLAEVMAAVEQLQQSGLAEQEEVAAMAQQLLEQLSTAQEESTMLQQQQQELTDRVTRLSATVQEKDEAVAAVEAELQQVSELAGQIRGVQFVGKELTLEVEMPAAVAAPVAAPPARRTPATAAKKAAMKDHKCAGLLVFAAASFTMDAWQTVRQSFAPQRRIMVDAASLVVAACSLAVLFHN